MNDQNNNDMRQVLTILVKKTILLDDTKREVLLRAIPTLSIEDVQAMTYLFKKEESALGLVEAELNKEN